MADATTLIGDLRQLVELAEAKKDIPSATWHVVWVPDTGQPVKQEFMTADEAAAFARTFAGQDGRIRVFYGLECLTTKPPFKYLLTHVGKFPLFDASGADEIDHDGTMTEREPLPVKAVKPAATDDDIDELPDDDDTEDEDDDDDE